ncbi:MAG: diaminopimelate decarboxylase [Pseudomonadota bacterium]
MPDLAKTEGLETRKWRALTRRGKSLFLEEVELAQIAQAVGTPAYVYSSQALGRAYLELDAAFEGHERLIAYAVKANSNLAVIARFAKLGAGADVVSEGEIRRALAAGVAPEKIVFSGVGKTAQELAFALKAGIGIFNLESEDELHLLDKVAADQRAKARVSVRLNPDIAAGGNDKIATGRATDKFGVNWDRAHSIYRAIAASKWLEAVGIDIHIGSQITSVEPYAKMAGKAADLVRRLRRDGHDIRCVDIGGGLGVDYARDGCSVIDPPDYAAAILEHLEPLGVKLILEPGRVLTAGAGVLLTSAIRAKRASNRRFVILDAAMNDMIRPALYGERHRATPIVTSSSGELAPVDLAGPVCESTDIFDRDVMLPALNPGDVIALTGAGAYGSVLSLEYNSRPRIPEIMVDGDQFAIVRKRRTYDQILDEESVSFKPCAV